MIFSMASLRFLSVSPDAAWSPLPGATSRSRARTAKARQGYKTTTWSDRDDFDMGMDSWLKNGKAHRNARRSRARTELFSGYRQRAKLALKISRFSRYRKGRPVYTTDRDSAFSPR